MNSDEEVETWYWKYDEHKLFLENDSLIRFRYSSIAFVAVVFMNELNNECVIE
jgi:hypothetical protein